MTSGLTWEGGTLWVGQFKGRAIHQIDAATGKLLKRAREDVNPFEAECGCRA